MIKFLTKLFILCFLLLFISECKGDYRSCIMKIPRRSVIGNCSSELDCREITDQGVDIGVKCGNLYECVVEKFPKKELCRDACVDSECGRLCEEHYNSQGAMYCIETRDHPNAFPHVIPSQPNKYYCTCVSSNEFIKLNLAE